MLVIHRMPEQAVHIGPDITVKVLAVEIRDPKTGLLRSTPRVVLGIEAPKDVRIVRDDAVRKEAS